MRSVLAGKAVTTVSLLVATTALILVAGCGGEPIGGAPLGTDRGAVEETRPVEATETVEATAPAPVAPAPAPAPAPPAPWPDAVAKFAAKVKWPSFYPTGLPKGMKLDSIDTLELESGSGLVCDIYFVTSSTDVEFMQGSPKTRENDSPAVGTTAWGTDTADIVLEDPEDPSGPKMIVYRKNGTLAELSGDASIEVLKSIAASMVLVK